MVAQNSFELLIGIRTLPVGTKVPTYIIYGNYQLFNDVIIFIIINCNIFYNFSAVIIITIIIIFTKIIFYDLYNYLLI